MNLNWPISLCISLGIEFTESLIEILLHSNTAESLAALQATMGEKGEHIVVHTMDSFKFVGGGNQHNCCLITTMFIKLSV